MNGKQAKRIRRTATLLWIKDVKPSFDALAKEYEEATDPDVLKNIQEKAVRIPTPRRLYRRLKHLYTRRA